MVNGKWKMIPFVPIAIGIAHPPSLRVKMENGKMERLGLEGAGRRK